MAERVMCGGKKSKVGWPPHAQELKRCGINSMQILDREQHAVRRRVSLQPVSQQFQSLLLLLQRIHREIRDSPIDGQRQQRRQQLVNNQHDHRHVDGPITPPNLKQAFFTTEQRKELVLEFDSHIVWSDALTSQFYLDGKPKQVASGSANGGRSTLKLKSPSKAKTVTYRDSANWNPNKLLYGQNGLAALTFGEVPIEESWQNL